MPPTATLDDIKAYQKRVEKNEITPHDLPPCPICNVESMFFKIHAYRERRFLVIIESLIKSVHCPLIRFRCPGCGTTMTYYPDFALPHKHYTRQSIMSHAGAYVESETSTYGQSTMADNELSVYPDSDKALAPSTIHRWVTTLGGFTNTCQKALSLILQQNPVSSICRDLAQLNISRRKYRTQQRKICLLGSLRLVIIEALFSDTFKISIFTKLAISCGFS
jgi:hypothetical protein